ncbi:MAG: hypothetical protein KAT04_08190 [Methylococcales bacterium]|nr:hypothetical protein [Methylococcales bacterium]
MIIKKIHTFISLLFLLQLSSLSASPIDTQSLYAKLQQQGVEYSTEVHTKDNEYAWNLLIHRNKTEQFLSVFDQESNELIFQYSHQNPMNGFIHQQMVIWMSTPLIASVWHKGVHGEQFVLLDPLNQEVIYKLTSAWPLSVQQCSQSIAITVSDDTDAEGNPVQKTVYWYNPDHIEVSIGYGSGCPVKTITDAIPPIDDSQLSSSLTTFLKTFDATINNKDFIALKQFIDPTILNSFGGEGGIAEFNLIWKKNQNTLFETLSQIRKGGGKLSKDIEGTESYCFPRMFTDFPNSLNAFTHGVLIGKQVPVYAKPDKSSKILTTLSHSIVVVDDWVWEKDSWQEIRIKDKRISYVESNKIRSPIDFRACLVQGEKGEWTMTLLIAGD